MKSKELKKDRKLKDREQKYAIIKLSKTVEVNKTNCGTMYKDKLWIIKVNGWFGETSTNFSCTNKGKREMLKFIKKECYL